MKGIELTERLIKDVQVALKAAEISRSKEQMRNDFSEYAQNLKFKLAYSIEEGWISMTCDITLPYSLTYLMQFLNEEIKLSNFKSGDKVNLKEFLNQLENQKQLVAEKIQKLQDSPNLIFISGQHQQTIFSLLETKLDEFHQEAQIVENCHNRLLELRNS